MKDRYWEREVMTHDRLWIKHISSSMVCGWGWCDRLTSHQNHKSYGPGKVLPSVTSLIFTHKLLIKTANIKTTDDQ